MYAYTCSTFGNREKQFPRIYALSKGMSPTAMKERSKRFYCVWSFTGDATPRAQKGEQEDTEFSQLSSEKGK